MKKRSHKRAGIQLSGRKKANTRWAVTALLVLGGLLILAKLVSFLVSLNKPITADFIRQKQYSWDGKTSINLVFKASDISVVNYDPSNKKIVILHIPDDAYFDLPGGRGSWRVGSIYALGEESNPPVGSELLKQSVSKLLGLPIDGFVTLENPQSSRPADQIISSMRHNPLGIIGFLRGIKTDLTPLEVVSLFRDMSETRADKITTLDLAASSITESELLPDSSRVLGIDNIKLDLFVRDKMSDMEIAQEGKTIAVFNATSHPGLANTASREITNMGGNVIFASNLDNPLNGSLVIGKNSSSTLTRLEEAFAPACLKKKCTSNDPKILDSRADINIILGEDFSKEQ